MKITYSEDLKMNHYEMKLVVNPKNKKLARLLIQQFKETLGEIEVTDDYRNKYPIPILSIYYVEIIDHKAFVYTDKEVYRLYGAIPLLKEKMIALGFYQINVRTLVNVKHVTQYRIYKGCRRKVVLDNGDMLVSSRHFKTEFQEMISQRADIEFCE
ncbi:MAG: LytTR family DNA-binding domain-containing protein [Coprobacillus sp.]